MEKPADLRTFFCSKVALFPFSFTEAVASTHTCALVSGFKQQARQASQQFKYEKSLLFLCYFFFGFSSAVSCSHTDCPRMVSEGTNMLPLKKTIWQI